MPAPRQPVNVQEELSRVQGDPALQGDTAKKRSYPSEAGQGALVGGGANVTLVPRRRWSVLDPANHMSKFPSGHGHISRFAEPLETNDVGGPGPLAPLTPKFGP
uniref:Uncharacterized protein n=1 Tax=Sphaerodactylus townsendi TaxID=933632 RepID=A0ACB8GA57_9SAUR